MMSGMIDVVIWSFTKEAIERYEALKNDDLQELSFLYDCEKKEAASFKVARKNDSDYIVFKHKDGYFELETCEDHFVNEYKQIKKDHAMSMLGVFLLRYSF